MSKDSNFYIKWIKLIITYFEGHSKYIEWFVKNRRKIKKINGKSLSIWDIAKKAAAIGYPTRAKSVFLLHERRD